MFEARNQRYEVERRVCGSRRVHNPRVIVLSILVLPTSATSWQEQALPAQRALSWSKHRHMIRNDNSSSQSINDLASGNRIGTVSAKGARTHQAVQLSQCVLSRRTKCRQQVQQQLWARLA